MSPGSRSRLVSAAVAWTIALFPVAVLAEPASHLGDLDVTAFGAMGDGVADDSGAFQAAVAACPVAERGWTGIAGDARPAGGCTIRVPTPKAHYRLARPVDVPGDRNVRFAGDSVRGARLRYVGAGAKMFRSGRGHRAHEWQDLVLQGGGIEFAADGRHHTAIRRCLFEGIDGYAIETSGPSALVYSEIDFNTFSNNRGHIRIAARDSDQILIHHNAFLYSSDVDVVINSTGVLLSDNDFEIRADALRHGAKPYLQIDSIGAGTGRIAVTRNRFGNEVAGADGPPREAVVIGPIDGWADTAVVGVHFDGNFFMGANAPSSTQARSAIRLNAPIRHLRVSGNEFGSYFGALVEEPPSGLGAAAKSFGNAWVDNRLRGAGPVFSRGGVGFESGGADLGRATPPERATVNLLPRTDALAAAWSRTAMGATRCPGPDGDPGSGLLLAADGTGEGVLRADAAGPAGATMLVASLWARAGSETSARLAIVEKGGRVVASRYGPILRLTREWQRFEIVAPDVEPKAVYGVEIRIGPPGTRRGSIEVAWPVLEPGGAATATLPNAGAEPRERPQGAVTIGGALLMGQGPRAPLVGDHRRGDLWLNSEPAVSGEPGRRYTLLGWRCIASGTPGTWVPMRAPTGD
jgi:hypothetical protein